MRVSRGCAYDAGALVLGSASQCFREVSSILAGGNVRALAPVTTAGHQAPAKGDIMHEITILFQLGAGRPEALTLPAGATVRDAREAKSVPAS